MLSLQNKKFSKRFELMFGWFYHYPSLPGGKVTHVHSTFYQDFFWLDSYAGDWLFRCKHIVGSILGHYCFPHNQGMTKALGIESCEPIIIWVMCFWHRWLVVVWQWWQKLLKLKTKQPSAALKQSTKTQSRAFLVAQKLPPIQMWWYSRWCIYPQDVWRYSAPTFCCNNW